MRLDVKEWKKIDGIGKELAGRHGGWKLETSRGRAKVEIDRVRDTKRE